MLPRKRNVPAEPAANPFALSRPQQISVSDEITAVKQAPPSLAPPPVPARVGAPSSRRVPASKPISSRPAPPPLVGASRKGPPPLPSSSRAVPPPIPQSLPRASFVPPSPEDFERASSRNGFPVVDVDLADVEDVPASSKPNSSDAIEPVAITRHPPPNTGAGPRPSASWAMALLALGVFGGVVTAIIAGGDTETILRAGARFIDPTAPQQAPVAVALGAAAQPGVQGTIPYVPPPAAAPPAPSPSPSPATPAAVADADKRAPAPEPKADPKADANARAALMAAIEPMRPAKPVEIKIDKPEAKKSDKADKPAAPRVAWTPPPRKAEPPPTPKPAAPPPPAKAASAPSAEEELAAATPKKRGRGDDNAAAAAAANALAKAQLEGSL